MTQQELREVLEQAKEDFTFDLIARNLVEIYSWSELQVLTNRIDYHISKGIVEDMAKNI